jgi:hypothetical protein
MARTAELLVLFIGSSVSALAQTTFGSITGTITDVTGAAVPNAQVKASELASGYTYESRTTLDGVYTIANLRAGTYTVEATAPGFSEVKVLDIRLAGREIRALDLTMQVGVVSSSIEVKAAPAATIETETARISQTRTTTELQYLPLNTRSVSSFLALAPGIGQATTVTATYRFNGSRRNQSEFTVDGISNVTYNGTQTSPLTSYIESFQEVRIDSADNTADAGAIGQVMVVSKSGTNQFHGSLFDYYVTPAFRARDFFSPTRATGISHRPGGSIGGPIHIPHVYNGHDRTFFYFDLETSRGSQTQNLINPTVPLAAWRTGDFSGLLPGTVVKSPTTGVAYPGNKIPATQLNPVSLALQNLFYPASNNGSLTTLTSKNFVTTLTHPFDPNTFWSGRLDHRFSDKTLVFARYTWQRQNSTDYEDNLPTIGRLTDIRNTRNAVASWSQIVSPTLVNELRYGMMYTNEPRFGAQNGSSLVAQLGLTGLLPNIPNLPGVPNISFSGLGLQGITQTAYGSPDFQNFNQYIQDQVTWTRGKHTVRAGTQIARYAANNVVQSNSLFGSFSFSNRYTGFPYADFLLGYPSTSSVAPPALNAPFLRWAYDFFITDEFKITPKLTANIGLRYELHPAWSSTNGIASTFDPSTGKVVIQDGSQNLISPYFPTSFVGIETASQGVYRAGSLIQTDKNNWAPRVGVAWRPFGQKTVFRAGFGIFYDIVPTQVNMGGTPFSVSPASYTNPTRATPGNPIIVFPQVYPATPITASTVSLPDAVKKDLRIPYSIQYNVTVEREIGSMGLRVSYVGTGTRQGEYYSNINQPAAGPGLYINKPRLFPQFGNLRYITNGAGHQYNGLNTEVRRPLAAGLLFDFNWTWARDIGDLERDQQPEDSYNLARERAPWADIPKHRITDSLIYDFPVGRGKKFFSQTNHFVDALIGGWQFTQSLTWSTGFFLTPLWTGPDPTGTANTTSSTAATVTIRPNVVTTPNFPADQRSVSSWFNLGAFAPPAAGTFGNSAKGTIVGPGSFVVDMGLAKTFSVRERLRFRLEFTGTNILNHTNFNPLLGNSSTINLINGATYPESPALIYNNPGVSGVITSTGNGAGGLDPSGPRAFRAGFRIDF